MITTEKFLEDIRNASDEARDRTMADNDHLTLGELIDQMKSADHTWGFDGSDKSVSFDFGTAIPTTLDSWRGSYDELALGYELSGYDNDEKHFNDVSAADFLKELEGAVGKTYDGWKGGEFTMSRDTPVWVANQGNSGSTAVIGILDNGYEIIILTGFQEM